MLSIEDIRLSTVSVLSVLMAYGLMMCDEGTKPVFSLGYMSRHEESFEIGLCLASVKEHLHSLGRFRSWCARYLEHNFSPS